MRCHHLRHLWHLYYDDWYRASLNLDVEEFDYEYMRDASTATCPRCGHTVELDSLVIEHGVWRLGS